MEPMPFASHNPKHPIVNLIAGVTMASGLGFFINTVAPRTRFAMPAFFVLLFLSVFLIASPFVKPIRRSLFLSFFITGWLFLRYIGLTNPIHTALLAIFLVSLDSLMKKSANLEAE